MLEIRSKDALVELVKTVETVETVETHFDIFTLTAYQLAKGSPRMYKKETLE